MDMDQILYYLETVDFKEKLRKVYEQLVEEESLSAFGHTLSNMRLRNFEDSLSGLTKRQRTLVELLNEYLAKKDMTQQELSMKSYLTKAYISNIFHKQINPSKQKLVRIAFALELNLEETAELLKSRGFLLNDSLADDVIVACIENREYDLDNVHDLMMEYADIKFL